MIRMFAVNSYFQFEQKYSFIRKIYYAFITYLNISNYDVSSLHIKQTTNKFIEKEKIHLNKRLQNLKLIS